MLSFFKKTLIIIWKDSVGSKIIAVGILTLIAIIWNQIDSTSFNSSIFIPSKYLIAFCVFVLVFGIIYFVLRWRRIKIKGLVKKYSKVRMFKKVFSNTGEIPIGVYKLHYHKPEFKYLVENLREDNLILNKTRGKETKLNDLGKAVLLKLKKN